MDAFPNDDDARDIEPSAEVDAVIEDSDLEDVAGGAPVVGTLTMGTLAGIAAKQV